MQNRASLRRLAVAAAMAVMLSASPSHAEALKEFGMGSACVLANLIYMPVKLVYALGGGLVTGMAYAFSGGDSDVVSPIADAAFRGDYVIEPAHLRGEKPITFIGRREEHQTASDWDSGGKTDPGSGGF